MRQAPTLKPLPQFRPNAWLTGTRAWLAGLALVAVLLVGLIARDTVLAKPAAAAIRTASADRGTVTSVVSGTGSLVPAGRMNVNFKVAGTLSEVDVRVGDTVKTGQVLARLDSTTQQAALSQAQASLASAQANLKATQTPLTSAQVAQLQHQVSAAQQNYNDTVASVNATNQADATTVANDQAKVNTDCGIDPGSLAPQPASSSATGSGGSSGFMVIDDTSSYVAVMAFPETDAARLAANQAAALTFDAIPNLSISGHVLSLSPSATVVSNVVDYYVSFVLNRTDPRLREGMTANAAVTVAQADNAIRVPNAAVQTQGGTTTVNVLANGQQVSTEVVTGIVGDSYTEIKAGLSEGDKVVLPALRTTGTSTTNSNNLLRGGGFGGGGIRSGGG